MFIEYTAHSELAQRLRERLKKIEEVGHFKFKIVERAGEKIVDQRHKSNAWDSEDCRRKECLICNDEFEEKISVHEQSNRVYDINGIAPTITSTSADIRIINLEL